MIIYSNKTEGFVEVFPYDIEDKAIKPSLGLILPSTQGDLDYLNKHFPEFVKLGYSEKNSHSITLKITGQRKVAIALKAILASPDYNHSLNEVLLKKLTVIAEHLAGLAAKKIPRPLPPNSKNYSNYHELKEKVTREPGTGVPRHQVIKVQEENSSTVEILKIMDSGRRISEIEAFNALCYALLLNDSTPLVYSTHDALGNRIGVLSEEIENFQSLQDYYVRKKNETGSFASPPQEDLIKAGIGSILGAGYVEEENDLSGANIGFDPVKCKVYKIDHNQTTWPLTSKYVGKDPEKRYRSSRNGKGIKAIDAFPITQKDLDEFPFLTDAQPINFPDHCDDKILNLENIEKDPKFIADVYTIFLKRILLDAQIYRKIAALTIGNPSLQDKFAVHKANRGALLKKELLKNQKFCDFFLENPNLKGRVLEEFRAFNERFNSISELQLDLNAIEGNYELLLAQMKPQSQTVDSQAVDQEGKGSEYSPRFFINPAEARPGEIKELGHEEGATQQLSIST